MIKIPNVFGDSNINLTKEYVQEEGVINSGLDDEEKITNVCYYRFRNFISLFINSFKDGQNITDEIIHSKLVFV